MGEYADALIDSMIDGCWGPTSGRQRRRRTTRVTCDRCGKTNLRWKNVTGGKWRVAEKNGGLHNCNATPDIERYMEEIDDVR